jgi:hypothetical protein
VAKKLIRYPPESIHVSYPQRPDLTQSAVIPPGGVLMAFSEKPIITSPFDAPAQHYELDGEGQPTGKLLPDRRESIHVVPVPAARRRGPKQAELPLETENRVTPNALINEIRSVARSAAEPMGREPRDAEASIALARSLPEPAIVLLPT